jgi:VWFA-related protein
MGTRFISFGCLFCLSLISLFAEQNGSATSESKGHPITLDVIVTDKSGKPVTGLQQQDFRLLDNKRPQTIVSYRAVAVGTPTNDPVEIVLLMDEVNTEFTNVALERNAITKFLQLNGGALAHPVSLVFFSDSGAQFGSPSKDAGRLIAELNRRQAGLRTIGRPQGSSGASEQLNLSLQALDQLAHYQTSRPGRKLVIWISPGWPFFSGAREYENWLVRGICGSGFKEPMQLAAGGVEGTLLIV